MCWICRIVAVLCSVEFDGEGVRRTGGSDPSTADKYRMTDLNLRGWLEALRTGRHDVEIVDDVTIPLLDTDCPEYIADELALWCHRHGLRSRRMERSRRDVVQFGFESFEAAEMFRQACGLPAE